MMLIQRRTMMNSNDEKFKIVIIGETGCGKSTLINALLGKIVLPESPMTATPIITYIEYLSQGSDYAEIIDVDQKIIEKLGIEEFIKKYCFNVTEQREVDRKRFSNISHSVLHINADFLRNGVQIIDTLGFSASNYDTETTESILSDNINLIFYVVSKNVMKDFEIDRIQNLLGYRTYQQIKNGHEAISRKTNISKLYFICNEIEGIINKGLENSICRIFRSKDCDQSAVQIDNFAKEHILIGNFLIGRTLSCGIYPYSKYFFVSPTKEETEFAADMEGRQERYLKLSDKDEEYVMWKKMRKNINRIIDRKKNVAEAKPNMGTISFCVRDTQTKFSQAQQQPSQSKSSHSIWTKKIETFQEYINALEGVYIKNNKQPLTDAQICSFISDNLLDHYWHINVNDVKKDLQEIYVKYLPESTIGTSSQLQISPTSGLQYIPGKKISTYSEYIIELEQAFIRNGKIKLTSAQIQDFILLYNLHKRGVTTREVEIDLSDIVKRLCSTNQVSDEFKKLLDEADRGITGSQVMVGLIYNEGDEEMNVQVDYQKAFHWYLKAATSNHAIGQYCLATMYEEGNYVQQNYAKAFTWYAKAARQGYAPALTCLGLLYEDGNGVAQNYFEAYTCYKKAAEQYLGRMYTTGTCLEQNYMITFQWYKKAADAGNIHAMYCLGMMYENGNGVTKNYTESFNWYKKSVILGCGEAMKKKIKNRK